jgi:hypothetical protein
MMPIVSSCWAQVASPMSTACGVLVTTWVVETNAVQRQVSPPYVGENPVRVSEPDSGVAIESLQYFDAEGNQLGAYRPASPLVYLPLPVLPGQAFTSVGIDPRTGQTIRVSGEPVERRTVDACGKLVDGWLVKLEIADAQGATSASRTEELVIATQSGGMVISQRIVAESAASGGAEAIDVTSSLGQVDPSPLPQEARS